jgi:hypothetical protein
VRLVEDLQGGDDREHPSEHQGGGDHRAAAGEAAGTGHGTSTPVRPADGTAWPRDLEVTRRAGGGHRFITLINHGEDSADVVADGRLVSVPAATARAANFRDVLSVVQAVPNGPGLGAFYWEPTWTVVPGNGWENQALWNYPDTALPAIADFAAR